MIKKAYQKILLVLALLIIIPSESKAAGYEYRWGTKGNCLRYAGGVSQGLIVDAKFCGGYTFGWSTFGLRKGKCLKYANHYPKKNVRDSLCINPHDPSTGYEYRWSPTEGNCLRYAGGVSQGRIVDAKFCGGYTIGVSTDGWRKGRCLKYANHHPKGPVRDSFCLDQNAAPVGPQGDRGTPPIKPTAAK